MKVIVAGLGRTGTTSLTSALQRLGYKTYHMEDMVMTKSGGGRNHLIEWRAVADGTRDVRAVLRMVSDDGFDATMDNPMCEFYREQLELWPKAKVILTEHPRGARGWAKSWTALMEMVHAQNLPSSVLSYAPLFRNMYAMRHVMGTRTMGLQRSELAYGLWNKPDGWLEEQYEKHNAHVRSHVPADQLLEFSVSQGWTPLCEFLGKSPPEDEPFPHLNDSSEMERMKRAFQCVAYGLPAVVVILGGILLSNRRNRASTNKMKAS